MLIWVEQTMVLDKSFLEERIVLESFLEGAEESQLLFLNRHFQAYQACQAYQAYLAFEDNNHKGEEAYWAYQAYCTYHMEADKVERSLEEHWEASYQAFVIDLLNFYLNSESAALEGKEFLIFLDQLETLEALDTQKVVEGSVVVLTLLFEQKVNYLLRVFQRAYLNSNQKVFF